MWWRWSMINYWTRLDQASKPILPPSLPLPPPHTVKLSSYRTPLVLVGNKKDLHMQRYHWLYTVVSIHPTPPPSSSCVEWWRTRWGRSWLQSGMPLLWSPQLNRTRYVHDVALTPGDVNLWYNSSWFWCLNTSLTVPTRGGAPSWCTWGLSLLPRHSSAASWTHGSPPHTHTHTCTHARTHTH